MTVQPAGTSRAMARRQSHSPSVWAQFTCQCKPHHTPAVNAETGNPHAQDVGERSLRRSACEAFETVRIEEPYDISSVFVMAFSESGRLGVSDACVGPCSAPQHARFNNLTPFLQSLSAALTTCDCRRYPGKVPRWLYCAITANVVVLVTCQWQHLPGNFSFVSWVQPSVFRWL